MKIIIFWYRVESVTRDTKNKVKASFLCNFTCILLYFWQSIWECRKKPLLILLHVYCMCRYITVIHMCMYCCVVIILVVSISFSLVLMNQLHVFIVTTNKFWWLLTIAEFYTNKLQSDIPYHKTSLRTVCFVRCVEKLRLLKCLHHKLPSCNDSANF